MKTLICNYCKKEFEARSRAKLYCSSKCKREMALKNKKEKMIREAREKLEREKVECPGCGFRFTKGILARSIAHLNVGKLIGTEDIRKN